MRPATGGQSIVTIIGSPCAPQYEAIQSKRLHHDSGSNLSPAMSFPRNVGGQFEPTGG
jgi:hypothetical protein